MRTALSQNNQDTDRETSPYAAYAYSYPHKTAYRPLDPPVSLRELWQKERREALFLYIHLPFCEMRCGFCNLFTTARPRSGFTDTYLDALRRQAEQVRVCLGDMRIARMAIGGGTPTFLECHELKSVLDIAGQLYGVDLNHTPVSVETSPRTAEPDKLRLLRDRGVNRISIGIQSFFDLETAAAGRAQKSEWVHTALHNIRAAGFPTLNLDLIYGLPGQTIETWLESLRVALDYAPEELYLYPLYVRPLTGLDRRGRAWEDIRLDCYRAGRGLLLSSGYRQVSMRMFRLQEGAEVRSPSAAGPVYCCQDDGMIGLGCGARSYTEDIHYSSEYAVGRQGVQAILQDYIQRPPQAFCYADFGYRLDAEDRRRRFVIKSLLQSDGMDLSAYQSHFGEEVRQSLPEIQQLEAEGWVVEENGRLRLSEAGMERSDRIGPWLYSPRARGLSEGYELR